MQLATPPTRRSPMSDGLEVIRLHREQTLAQLIAERLEAKILRGDIKSGDRLNEAALAAEFGVSRGPIREAARTLERSGLVNTVANRGSFVRSVSLEEVLDLYRVRAVITGLACSLACKNYSTEAGTRLQALIREMDVAAAAGDSEAYYSLNLKFHQALVELSGSPRVRELNGQLVKEAHLFRARALHDAESMRSSNEEHRAIVTAVASGDTERAQKLGADHVMAGRARLVKAYCA